MTTKEVIEYLRQRETELRTGLIKLRDHRDALNGTLDELRTSIASGDHELQAVRELLKVMLNEDT